MKILLSSHRFAPDIGGIETASELLANAFTALGHDVRIVTQTPDGDAMSKTFPVIREPSTAELCRQIKWCDVYFQNNISLQSLWPVFLVGRPWVVAHQTWITNTKGNRGWRDYLKLFIIRYGTNVAISEAIARELGVRSTLIGNPYREELFQLDPTAVRDRDLVFLGRLVSDKGADLLIAAISQLSSDRTAPTLTIIGTGPEEARLRALVAELGLTDRVHFAGALTGEALAAELNRHRVMVVPSRWAEPFGIVALEGIACGCVVIGSSGGGLIDAIGPCGLTFSTGDSSALAAAIQGVRSDDDLIAQLRSGAAAHLARHTSRAVAERYLALFARCIG